MKKEYTYSDLWNEAQNSLHYKIFIDYLKLNDFSEQEIKAIQSGNQDIPKSLINKGIKFLTLYKENNKTEQE